MHQPKVKFNKKIHQPKLEVQYRIKDPPNERKKKKIYIYI